MITDKFSYLVIENAPDVCEGIIRRMNGFDKWQSLGYCTGVKEAMEKISSTQPHLIYLDWSLNGGSAFEILQSIQNKAGYHPYIIFNTGFQKDNPEIPQEIINNYKVDKYLVKPLWENLRNNLPAYLKEAEEKTHQQAGKNKAVWVQTDNGHKVLIDLTKIICICQHPTEQRSRNIYLSVKEKEITIMLQWQKCCDLLKQNGIEFFVTKTRSHLVLKEYVEKFEKPFVRLKHFPFKIEVVKENIRGFENWLIG
jgi:DNA-binding response OmpR family regulator